MAEAEEELTEIPKTMEEDKPRRVCKRHRTIYENLPEYIEKKRYPREDINTTPAKLFIVLSVFFFGCYTLYVREMVKGLPKYRDFVMVVDKVQGKVLCFRDEDAFELQKYLYTNTLARLGNDPYTRPFMWFILKLFFDTEVMTKDLEHHSVTDSEIASLRSQAPNKLGAILCPAVCALFIVCVFAVSFFATKMIYEQYDNFCVTSNRRFDVAKLYIIPHNITVKIANA